MTSPCHRGSVARRLRTAEADVRHAGVGRAAVPAAGPAEEVAGSLMRGSSEGELARRVNRRGGRMAPGPEPWEREPNPSHQSATNVSVRDYAAGTTLTLDFGLTPSASARRHHDGGPAPQAGCRAER